MAHFRLFVTTLKRNSLYPARKTGIYSLFLCRHKIQLVRLNFHKKEYFLVPVLIGKFIINQLSSCTYCTKVASNPFLQTQFFTIYAYLTYAFKCKFWAGKNTSSILSFQTIEFLTSKNARGKKFAQICEEAKCENSRKLAKVKTMPEIQR